MSTERAVIDLDQHDHRPAESTAAAGRLLARRKATLRLVAAFLVGATLGGLGMSELRNVRDRRERNAVVTLVAVPRSADFGGSSTRGSVQLSGQLLVINTGPAPITVRSVQAERSGVAIRSTGQPRLIPPAGTAELLVELRFDCATAFRPEPVPLRFSVQTDDEQLRTVARPVALVGSDWERDSAGMCGPGA